MFEHKKLEKLTEIVSALDELTNIKMAIESLSSDLVTDKISRLKGIMSKNREIYVDTKSGGCINGMIVSVDCYWVEVRRTDTLNKKDKKISYIGIDSIESFGLI